MTIYNVAEGGNAGGIKASFPAARLMTAQVDLGTLGEDEVSSGNVFSAADVIPVLNIPAYTFVLDAGLICTTAEDTTLTLDLGDGDDPNGYVDGYDAESTGVRLTAVDEGFGTDNVAGKLYASADTIDLTIATVGAQTAHQCVVTVFAVVAGPIPTS